MFYDNKTFDFFNYTVFNIDNVQIIIIKQLKNRLQLKVNLTYEICEDDKFVV